MSHHHHHRHGSYNRGGGGNDGFRHTHKIAAWLLIIVASIGLFNMLIWHPIHHWLNH